MPRSVDTIPTVPGSPIAVDHRRPFTTVVLARSGYAPFYTALRTNGHRANFPSRLILRDVSVVAVYDDGTALVHATAPALRNARSTYLIERKGLLAVG
jgi:hypothetical protein